MDRVPELIDVWFDSGAMPYAQWHYPFENGAMFENQYPADYICEAVDQTRGWFYSLHAISTLLNEQVSFRNVLSLGHILDGEGKKMSKSLGNIVEPWDVIRAHGADALRWYLYTATPPGQARRFSADLVAEVLRNFTLTLWNVYSFFVTYANLDGRTRSGSRSTATSTNGCARRCTRSPAT
jgi:isoleucyl-tRNA synthetase